MQKIAQKREETWSGGADGQPLALGLRERPVMRFVRLTTLEANFCHPDDVQLLVTHI